MPITVFLADDNLLIREGVRALIELDPDLEVVGIGEDFDSLIAGAEAAEPQVVVTDIRMPPSFRREGIEASRVVRKRHPGTGVVILSQYDDPEYVVSLLADGAAGYAYLLKDRVAEGDQLARAIKEVASGGSMLDPVIVGALTQPIGADGQLSADEEDLLRRLAQGTPIKAMAVALKTTPADIDGRIDRLFRRLADDVSAGNGHAVDRLKALHQAIVEREEQGETLSRLLPGGLADKLRVEGRHIGLTEELIVSVLMCDVRGYSSIAEFTDPARLAAQLNEHRAAMNHAILGEGGTVMQFIGDAVMAVFGAPQPLPDHAARAVAAAQGMHAAQDDLNLEWASEGRAAFGLGIAVSTGPVAAALLGSEERLEYTLVGDTVNLTQRMQEWAQPGETVVSEATYQMLDAPPASDVLAPSLVKGRATPVGAYRFPRRAS